MATIKLKTPITEEQIRELKIGDLVLLSGVIMTGRDAAHKYIMENHPKDIAPYLNNGVLYHCGPVVEKKDGEWRVIAAGPTTSIREEPYESDVIEEYTIRGIIGKGGMGDKTLNALQKYGAVYFHATGGAAALQGAKIKKVLHVFLLEKLGVPEAFWVFEVEDFPVVVTMDSHGGSLHKEVKESSEKVFNQLIN